MCGGAILGSLQYVFFELERRLQGDRAYAQRDTGRLDEQRTSSSPEWLRHTNASTTRL
jgi:hypothetical protein